MGFPDSSGDLAVSLLASGHYEVQVSGTGYVSTRKSIGVACSPSDCSLCAPSIMVPLSPALGSDELRLTLGGNQLVENLDIFTVFRDTSSACVMSPNNHKDNSCPGIERVTGTNGQGVETVTFKQPESRDTKHVYTIYLEWTTPVGNEDVTFPDTNAWVSLTDGIITEEIHMEAKVYGGERRWLAGCLLLAGGADPSFQLRPLNVYETGYESGLAMIPGRSCDCSYSLGGCKITSAPPVGFACECKYQGYWTCGAQLRKCETDEDCPGHCTDKTCCRRGGGDCGGYWG